MTATITYTGGRTLPDAGEGNGFLGRIDSRVGWMLQSQVRPPWW
jgi:hypothetical protein